MWSNPPFPVDLVTFTEEILYGKLHILWGGTAFKTHFRTVTIFRRAEIKETQKMK